MTPIVVDSRIRIPVAGLPPELLSRLRRSCSHKVNVVGECHEWTDARDKDGYGISKTAVALIIRRERWA